MYKSNLILISESLARSLKSLIAGTGRIQIEKENYYNIYITVTLFDERMIEIVQKFLNRYNVTFTKI